MTIPIIIFHLGNQGYVRLCLQQALKSGNSNIVLITDNVKKFRDLQIKIVSYKSYSDNVKKFKKIYKHFSKNSLKFELICIIRWMCIYEYMKKYNIERAFICDSDVLIYDNIHNIDEKYLHSYDFMLCSSPSKNLTGGQSIWNFDKLEEFILFIFKFYTTQKNNMIKWHRTYNKPGGICDMTLLYYFSQNHTEFVGLRLPDFKPFSKDLTQIFNNEFTFDLHLSSSGNHLYPDDYEINKSTNNKNIKFVDGKPYCFCKHLNKDIRFILLHFQGENKKIMNDYYKI